METLLEQFIALLTLIFNLVRPLLPTLQGFLFGAAAFFALNSLLLFDKEQTLGHNVARLFWTIVASVLVAYAVTVH